VCVCACQRVKKGVMCVHACVCVCVCACACARRACVYDIQHRQKIRGSSCVCVCVHLLPDTITCSSRLFGCLCVGLARTVYTHTPYMTVYLVPSPPKTPYTHHMKKTYTVCLRSLWKLINYLARKRILLLILGCLSELTSK